MTASSRPACASRTAVARCSASSAATVRGRRQELGGAERLAVERDQRDAGQELIGIREAPGAQRESPQLDAQQPAGDALVVVPQPAEHRFVARLGEQDAAERARVEVDDRHTQPKRSARPSANSASVVPAGEGVGARRATMVSSGSSGTVAPKRSASSW